MAVRPDASRSVIFGAFMPQGWKMELASIDGAEAKWATAVAVAQTAEWLGYDSLWVYDHFHNVPLPAHETVFECWTTLAAISQRTSRIRLGQMVGCNSYRQPSLLAKITSTIDVISGGRLDWGIGAGWYENEYRGYGYEFPAARDRIGMLRESVEIVRSMWTEAETTYDGQYYKVQRANCDPKPLQHPHPPIWIGGGGEQLTLRVVARFADCSNFGGKPDEWKHKRRDPEGALQGGRTGRGRDPQDVGTGGLRAGDGGRDRWPPARSLWGEPVESWRDGNLVGTPEQVCEKIQRYVDLGCGGFIPWCADYPDTTTLELFATKVIPQFRDARPVGRSSGTAPRPRNDGFEHPRPRT